MKVSLSLGAILVLLVPSLFAQWAPAPQGNYPQSQYPEGGNPMGQAAGQPAGQSAGGQGAAPAPDPGDLQHGVARLSIVQGDVNVQRGDNGQLTAAVMNAPVMTHDQVQTSGGSRAEIQFDEGTLLRLGENTSLNLADVQYQRAQVQLGLGTLIFRVLPNAQTQLEIDTPSVGIRAVTQGEYRISVFNDGTSQVTVRTGQLELFGPRGSERIDAGQSVMVRGDASDPEMQTMAEAPRDQFDQWSEDRDREFAAPRSYQYVNTSVQGAADLDQYGNWVPSGYGQVWQPQGVASDWAPYSNGQWSYEDYYGWTWIDYSPWGWAPYHYGRWFMNPGYGWCWYPGSRFARAYWNPALVAFFGFGRGVGVGLGALGWVALAPFELFHPWWGHGYGAGFRTGYAIGAYRNAFVRGGALTASLNGFGGPHQRFGFATRSELQGASAFAGRLPVTATRASYSYSSRQPFANNRLAPAQSRSFFHASPSQMRSFAGTSRSFAGTNGGTRSYSQPSGGGWQKFGAPAARSGYTGSTGAASAARGYPSSGSGWQRFGTPSPAAGAGYRSYSGSQEPSGWHTFGEAPAASRNSYQAPRYSGSSGYQAPRSNYPSSGYSQSRPSSGGGSNRAEHYSNSSGGRSSQSRSSSPAPRSSGGGGHSESHSSGGGGHHRR